MKKIINFCNNNNFSKPLLYKTKKSLKYFWGIIPIDIRYGNTFRKKYKFLNKSQWWSKQEIIDYQMANLKVLLEHAFNNAPHYTEAFNERSITPASIKDINDLQQLPLLTKEIINKNVNKIIANNYPPFKRSYVTTGGSTGIPMGFFWEKGRTDIMEQAFVWRSWNWGGYYFGQKRVVLRGNVINDSMIENNNNYFEYDKSNNALILSSFDLCEKYYPKYIKKIIEFNPAVIQGYPSSLYLLARYLQSKGRRLKNIQAIFTSSENLYAKQRDMIEEAFSSKIYDHYGNTERTCIAFQCELTENYHIIPEYGITELLDSQGHQIDKPGQVGEIVATGFNNYSMPFIRYKTGDLAQYVEDHCKCGRNHQLIKGIEGRIQETIITNDNRLISMTAINMHSDVFANVHQIQFYQKEKGALIIRIVKKEKYSVQDTDRILNEILKKTGNQLELGICFVGKIPRTKRGKHRWLIQKLNLDDFLKN